MAGDRFFIRTNDRAKNFRLMEAPVSDPSRRRWKEVIPHDDDILLEAVRRVSESPRGVDSRRRGLNISKFVTYIPAELTRSEFEGACL